MDYVLILLGEGCCSVVQHLSTQVSFVCPWIYTLLLYHSVLTVSQLLSQSFVLDVSLISMRFCYAFIYLFLFPFICLLSSHHADVINSLSQSTDIIIFSLPAYASVAMLPLLLLCCLCYLHSSSFLLELIYSVT